MAINLKAWKNTDGEVVYIEEGQTGEGILGPNHTRMPGLDRVVSNDFSLSEDFASTAQGGLADTAVQPGDLPTNHAEVDASNTFTESQTLDKTTGTTTLGLRSGDNDAGVIFRANADTAQNLWMVGARGVNDQFVISSTNGLGGSQELIIDPSSNTLDINNKRILDVNDPVLPQDAATKAYVDQEVLWQDSPNGLRPKTLTDNVGIGTDPDPVCSLHIKDDTGKDFCLEQVGTSGSAFMALRKARGTIGSEAALISGDKVAGFDASAHDGTTYANNAEIGFYVTENQTPTAKGSEIRLETTENGTTGTATRITVEHNGDITLNDYNAARDDGPVDRTRVLYTDANGTAQVGQLRTKQYTQLSGRFEIDSDYDWACWSDPNFGPSLQDWDLDLADSGVGGIPAIDWDGMGLLFPSGATLKRIFVKVRGNSTDIDSIQTYVRAHDVDLLAGNAIDSNGEIGAVEVSGITTFDLDAGLGSANDVRAFEIPLNDYTFTNDGDLHLMMKAVNGSLTGNRQLRCTIFIEWEQPI